MLSTTTQITTMKLYNKLEKKFSNTQKPKIKPNWFSLPVGIAYTNANMTVLVQKPQSNSDNSRSLSSCSQSPLNQLLRTGEERGHQQSVKCASIHCILYTPNITRCFTITRPSRLLYCKYILNKSVESYKMLQKRVSGYNASRTRNISYFTFTMTSIKTCKTLLDKHQLYHKQAVGGRPPRYDLGLQRKWAAAASSQAVQTGPDQPIRTIQPAGRTHWPQTGCTRQTSDRQTSDSIIV